VTPLFLILYLVRAAGGRECGGRAMSVISFAKISSASMTTKQTVRGNIVFIFVCVYVCVCVWARACVHSDRERSFPQTRPMIDDRYGVVSARRRWRLMKTDDRRQAGKGVYNNNNIINNRDAAIGRTRGSSRGRRAEPPREYMHMYITVVHIYVYTVTAHGREPTNNYKKYIIIVVVVVVALAIRLAGGGRDPIANRAAASVGGRCVPLIIPRTYTGQTSSIHVVAQTAARGLDLPVIVCRCSSSGSVCVQSILSPCATPPLHRHSTTGAVHLSSSRAL